MDNVVSLPVPDAESTEPATIDITSEAFARRLGNLLSHRRTGSQLSLRQMARHSNKHFSRRDLRRFEAGETALDAVTAAALASLYKVDLAAILPTRTEIEIDAGGGILRTGGVDAVFEPGDPDSILETYLRLVRRLRNQERDAVISLRREDIEGLAAFLGRPGETVVEQLGALMGATKTQRRLMAGMFITGAMVITVAAPGAAAFMSDGGPNESVGASSAPVSGSVIELGVDDGGPGFDGPGFDGPGPSGDTTIGNSVLLHLDDAGPGASDVGIGDGSDEIAVSEDGAADVAGGTDASEDGTPGQTDGGADTTSGPAPDPGATIPAPADEIDAVSTGAPPVPETGDTPVVEMPVPGEVSADAPAPGDTPGDPPGTDEPAAGGSAPVPSSDPDQITAPVEEAVDSGPPAADADVGDSEFEVGPPPVPTPDVPLPPAVEVPVPSDT